MVLCLDSAKSVMLWVVLLVAVGVSLQCKSKVEPPVQGEGEIRSERLVQLESDRSSRDLDINSNNLETNSNSLDINSKGLNIKSNVITSLVDMKVDDIEQLTRSAKQASETSACPELFQDGYQFYSSVVREQVLAKDVDDCASRCKQTAYCRSFSFSSIKNLDENCHLSELSVGDIDISQELTETSTWSVYGVAEDDSCDQTTEPTTTEKQEANNCNCNGFIDNVGGGECRQQNYGHWWCYVDSENDCTDSQKDNTMPMFSRSSNACSPGPCECNTFKFKKLGTRDICMNDIFDDDRFCYVPLESRCKDKKASKFFPSVYWSLKACSENDGDEEGSGDDTSKQIIKDEEGEATSLKPYPEEEEGVTYHRTWNFTSSHEECANYCKQSERCQYMHSKYDTKQEICHLSTKPFYILTHVHYGHHLGQWIKK